MKKNLTKTVAFGMTAVMTVCAAGCGKKNDTKDTDTTENSGSEYSYTVEYTDLTQLEGSWIYEYVLDGDDFYFTDEKYDDKTGTSTLTIRSMNLSSPDDIKDYITYQGDDTHGYNVTAIHPGDDGNLTFVKAEYTYNPDAVWDSASSGLDDISEDDLITEDIIAQLGYNLEEAGLEFSDVEGMKVSEFIQIYNQLTGNTEEDGYIDNSKYYLVTIDAEGNEVSSTDITASLDSVSIYNCVWSGETAYSIISNWNEETDEEYSTLVTLDAKTGEISAQQTNEVVEQIMVTGNGTLLGLGYNDDYDYVLKKYDTDTQTFSDIKDSALTGYWVESAAPAGDNSFCYVCDNNLYLYDLSTNKDTKLLSFVDCNISGDNYPVISYTDEEHITVLAEDYSTDTESYTLNKLTRVKTADLKEKTVITLGCFTSDDTVEKAIVKFNKSNPDYKIVMKTYFDWNSEDGDYDDALSEFNDDILAGTAPDLIDLSGMDLSEYSGKGLFTDLYPYLNSDSDLSKKDLQENILKLCEDNGALYALPATYTITGLASAKDLLGDDDFTIEKFAEIIQNNPDKSMLSNSSRDDILSTLYTYNKSYFVDENAKTCNFTDGTFAKILEIAKTFPTQDELDASYDDDTFVSEPKKIADGSQLFYGLSMSDFGEYQVAATLFNNNFNVTGYPTVSGNNIGAYINSSMYAINAKSEYKDECWSFIKQMFESTTSSSWYSGFAVDKEIFEQQLTEASTPQMTTDENGNEVEESKGGYSFGDDFEIDIYALTDTQVAQLREIVDSANVLVSYTQSSDAVYDIISEEVEAYYSGEKSAADVCSVIQSRANILVNEDN